MSVRVVRRNDDRLHSTQLVAQPAAQAGAGDQIYTDRSFAIEEFARRNDHRYNKLIFTKATEDQINPSVRNHVVQTYHIPDSFFDELYLRSNGFAIAQQLKDSSGEDAGQILYFRYLVKHVPPVKSNRGYYWNEMTFLLHLDLEENITFFCVDVPENLQNRMVTIFNETALDMAAPDRAIRLLSAVLSDLVVLYDDSVWSLRHVIRDIEKERDGGKKEPDFMEYHNQARHAIHICEVLKVALKTTNELQSLLTKAPSDGGSGIVSTNNPTVQSTFKSEMCRWVNMLGNIELRSQAIEKRFLNEINLGFNQVSQADSVAMKDISVSMHIDSRGMRGIAAVTLFFLPATFVSTIFSMAFFNTSVDDTGRPKWVVAPQFYIYWVVTIPLTLFTLTVFWLWKPAVPVKQQLFPPKQPIDRSYTLGEKRETV